MKTLNYLPIKKENAGSLIGVSYIGEYIKCPRRWFYRYYQPTTNDEGVTGNTGIEPHGTAPALITGSLFHNALAAWYESGCVDGHDTGNYILDVALDVLNADWEKRADEYYDTTTAEEDLAMIKEMLIAYTDVYGPTGTNPDYPKIKIVCDQDGKPLIEREYATPLGYGDYFLTCKADAIIEDEGYTKVFEHKTTVASYVMSRISSIHYDAQFTGEIFTLNNNITPLSDAGGLFGVKANVIIKKRSPRSKYGIATRETTNRTADQLQDFANTCVDTLMQIDDRVKHYEEWLERGVEQTEALSVWFPVQGTFNGECEAYRRPCDFYMMCKAPTRAASMLGGYKPRTYIPEPLQSFNTE